MGYFSNNDTNYYNMNESERKELLIMDETELKRWRRVRNYHPLLGYTAFFHTKHSYIDCPICNKKIRFSLSEDEKIEGICSCGFRMLFDSLDLENYIRTSTFNFGALAWQKHRDGLYYAYDGNIKYCSPKVL